MAKYVAILAPEARQDLRDIRRHTRQEWGALQASTYVETIWETIYRIESFPEIGRLVSNTERGVRMILVGRHILYYRNWEGRIEVIRIFHERMDQSPYQG